MSDLQTDKKVAEEFFDKLFYGLHHLPSPIKEFGYGWSVASNNRLASTDYNDLTRMVLLAHDMCVRVEIIPKGMNRYLIAVWKRSRDGGLMQCHPTIEKAIDMHREFTKNKFPQYSSSVEY